MGAEARCRRRTKPRAIPFCRAAFWRLRPPFFFFFAADEGNDVTLDLSSWAKRRDNARAPGNGLESATKEFLEAKHRPERFPYQEPGPAVEQLGIVDDEPVFPSRVILLLQTGCVEMRRRFTFSGNEPRNIGVHVCDSPGIADDVNSPRVWRNLLAEPSGRESSSEKTKVAVARERSRPFDHEAAARHRPIGLVKVPANGLGVKSLPEVIARGKPLR